MECYRKREVKPVYVKCRIHYPCLRAQNAAFMHVAEGRRFTIPSLLPNSSIEHVGMDHLHQPVVVPVVHMYADDNRSLHCDGSLKRGRDLIGRFYTQPFCAKSFGKPDNIDGTKSHARKAPVFRHFLNANHVIRAVDPNQVYEVASEPNGRLKFHCGEQESPVSRDGDYFLAWTNQTRGDCPGQTHTEGLLSVGHQNLPRTIAVEMSGQPNMERPHIQTQRHIVAEQCLKFVHETHGMDRHPIQDGGPFGEYGPVSSDILDKLRICRGCFPFYLG